LLAAATIPLAECRFAAEKIILQVILSNWVMHMLRQRKLKIRRLKRNMCHYAASLLFIHQITYLMKKSIFMALRHLALLFIFSMLAMPKAQASHIAGAEIFYDHLGGNQYRISTILYRDCSGIMAPSTVCMNFRSVGCGTVTNTNFTLNRVGLAVDITPLCPGQVSRCTSPTGVPGRQRFTYEATVTLPSTCNTWVFRFNLDGRQSSITTLSSANTQTFYLEARIYNANLLNTNSSVRFSNVPRAYGCPNVVNYYDHGAYDPDGDSLVYSLTPCQRGVSVAGGTANSPVCNPSGNNSVTYVAGRSGSSPLYGTIAVNPTTGHISYTPTQSQVAVVCIEVKEYRNGQLIGSVLRDMEFTLTGCSNRAPIISSPSTNVSTCVNQPICVQFAGSDLDTANQLNMTWDNSIAGATFSSTSGTNAITGQLCWTPTPSDTGMHYFTVSISDNSCPFIGSNSYNYSIYVAPINSQFQYLSTYFCQSTVSVIPLITGNPNGIFSAQPSGLDIDSLTGSVDLMNSNIGIYTITYQVADSFCYDTTTAIFEIDLCSGIHANTATKNNFQIAPNPNTGSFLLQNKGEMQIVNIELMDVLGRRLYSQNNIRLPANGALPLQIEQLPAATYYLRVSGENIAPSILSVRILEP
jgi:hypothetical protein